jgi:formate-dependent nitrite reductase membrane component NrfD
MPEYASVPVLAYDWTVVTYFFLGGLSAGAFLFSVVATHWKQELRPLAKAPALIAPVALAIGMLFLLLDLGKPFRAYRLLVHFNPGSALSWGVWFLNVFLVLSVAHAWLTLKGRADTGRKPAVIGVPFALLVAAYTGVLLTQSPGKPLWHSALVPALFVNGALISGIAVALLASAGSVGAELRAKVGKFLAGLVILEVALIAVELIVLVNAGGESAAAARGLLGGGFGFLFLVVEILLGAVIPAGILLRSKGSVAAQTVAAALILIGIFTMRFVVVVGGQVIH